MSLPALPPPPLPKTKNNDAAAPTTTPTSGTLRRSKPPYYPQKIVLYGTGGIGKTTLAALGPKPVIIDINNGARSIDVPAVSGINEYSDLAAWLLSPELDEFTTVIIDTVTDVEQLLKEHIIKTVPTSRDGKATSLQSYGFGNGYRLLSDHFVTFLGLLDTVSKKNKNIVLIAHDKTSTVPNPKGDDYLRYEPALYKDKSCDLPQILKGWCDHLLFLQYDIAVNRDGIAVGNSTRSIITQEIPTALAKSRTLPSGERLEPRETFDTPEDSTLWTKLLKGFSNATT
jgi:hypothetical protein